MTRFLTQMLKQFYLRLVVITFLLLHSTSSLDVEFPRCNCDGDGDDFWTVESILRCQKVSDFFIAAAYFSIPLELLYFVFYSHVFPFKWVLFQFGGFIVLCGLTHLVNVFTYEPHSFLVMLSLTIAKFFTALVSFATVITLLTLIPQLLQVKVRENFLMIKAQELDREVVLRKRLEEVSWHVRMLTQEIRKSLDRHTILYTTLVELSKALDLQNCVVWMPNEEKTMMNLTHELSRGSSDVDVLPVPIDDPDVCEINDSSSAKLLMPDCLLACRRRRVSEPGEVAAIRMQMLKVSDFKGKTPEMIQACYAILVLVLPRDGSRVWSSHELEIVEVVADQVAVALSHAAILEESQLMREKLIEQNEALQQARTDAMMASKARNSFQNVMSLGMKRPMQSISGFLSLMLQENLSSEKRLIVEAMAKTSSVTAKLIDNIMDNPAVDGENLTMETGPFSLHSTIRGVVSIAQALCISRDFGFNIQVENGLPNCVIGDEKRIIQVIMHVVGNLLSDSNRGQLTFLVHCENQVENEAALVWTPWMSSFPEGYSSVKIDIGIKRSNHSSSTISPRLAKTPTTAEVEMGLSFNMCKKLVQMMQGNLWTVSNSQGLVESMKLLLRFQVQSLDSAVEIEDPSKDYS